MEAARYPRRWWALAVLAAAQFMVIMDTSIIGVAMPKIQADLGFSQDDLQWVFNAYVIAFGGLLLVGGRLADHFGARRLFLAGWLVLAAGSLAAGLAQTQWLEIAGRATQGAGAALLAPAALTLLMMLFGGEPRELGRAMALYGAAAPAGGTAGVFLGGVITEWLTWPWVFLVNLPMAAVVVAGGARVLPTGGGRHGQVNVLDGLLATAGLATLVYGVVRAPQEGWASASTVGALVAAAALLSAFGALQAVRRAPLVPLSIFRTPNLGAANVAMALLGAAWIPMWFFLNLYLQQVLGYGAFESGAALLPMTGLIMLLLIVVTPRLMGRFAFKTLIAGGLVVLAAGLVGLAQVPAAGTFTVDVLPASLIAAAGMSLAFIPAMMAAISAARPDQGGLASGIVNTSYQIGSALGLAAMTALASAHGADGLGDPGKLTDGFHAAFLGAAGIAAAGALLAVTLLRKPGSSRTSTTESPAEEPTTTTLQAA